MDKSKGYFVREATGLTRSISGLDALIANLATMGVTTPIFYMYFASLLYPGVTPPPSGPLIVQLLSYAFVPIVAFVGVVIYAVAYYNRKSHGIDIALNFRQIPPE